MYRAATVMLAVLAIYKASRTGKLTFTMPHRARRLGEYAAVGRQSMDLDDDETVYGDGSIKSN